MRYSEYWPVAKRLWDTMQIDTARSKNIALAAARLKKSASVYQDVQRITGVPYPLIAAIHYRESSADFMTYLGNGQVLSQRTTIVPKGRGPFATWQQGAIDALMLDGLADVQDWRLEKQLYYAELFNGAGYWNRRQTSPYVWAGTNHQVKGKYRTDGKFDKQMWDIQPGVAALMLSLYRLDAEAIMPQRET